MSTQPGKEGRDSSPDFAAARASGARRRCAIVGVLAIVIAGGVAYATVASRRAEEAARLEAASELRACLLRAPLEENETAALRFRRLQLPEMVRPAATADDAAALWPRRCHRPLLAVKELLKHEAPDEDLKKLEDLANFVKRPAAHFEDASQVIEPAMAYLEETIPGAIPAGALPPAVLSADTITAIPPLAARGTVLSKAYTEDNPGLALPILITEESLEAPLLCSFAEATAAQCSGLNALAAVKGHGLRMLGTSDESSANLIFAGRRGSEGVFVPGSSTPVTKLYSYGGYAAKNGTVSVLGWDLEAKAMVLVQQRPGAAVTQTTLNPNFNVGNYFYSSQLLWDQVLVRGITPDNERRLFNLPLGADADSFSLVDIGELTEPGLIREGEEEQPHITGCRTSKATIVRVRGASSDFITFRVNEKFSMPVLAPTSGVLGCHGSTATLVTAGYTKDGTHLYHTVCTSAGCEVKHFNGAALDRGVADLRPEEPLDVQAVDLAGNLLVVWLAGQRGGLRMRIAKPELFEKTADVLLFDDLVSEHKLTKISSLLGFRLYSRERFAVLLLSSMSGLHAFRILPEGRVEPFAVKTG